MSVTVVAFFNNKGGVGKTSLAYHLAWMFADRGNGFWRWTLIRRPTFLPSSSTKTKSAL